MIGLANRIQPGYFPISQPYILEGRHILVLWCPAGDNRPYTAPTTLGNGAQRQHYVRIGSRSIIAQGENLRRLQELAARIPFDDRVNNQAAIQDFDLGLIQAHLQEIRSDLYAMSTKTPFEDLCRSMLIAKGPNEDIRPVNAGLLFFCKEPERFFPRAWIELVWHEDNSGKKFREVYFKGPVQKQLRDVLSFLKTNIIKEIVVKHSGKAEADRFFNYPYAAIEEAVSNAVYHKSYELRSPIEVQVFPDKITILSHPGPVPPVNAQVLATQRQIIAREYRNRRIGDFLKELHLTEGRGTGFPTIYNAMEANGSPKPSFDTDENTYFLATFLIHPGVQTGSQAEVSVSVPKFSNLEDVINYCNQAGNEVSNQAGNQAGNEVSDLVISIINTELNDKVVDILKHAANWIKREDLFDEIGLSGQTKNRKKYLDPLVEIGWVSMQYPERRTHPNQRYKITESGIRLLNLIEKSREDDWQ